MLKKVSKDAQNAPERPQLILDYNACVAVRIVLTHRITFVLMSTVYQHVTADKTNSDLVFSSYVVFNIIHL
jgi:hypothetical protein